MRGVLSMIHPVVIGMILSATATILLTSFFALSGNAGIEEVGKITSVSFASIGIALISFWWIHIKDKSPIAMLAISAGLGILCMWLGVQ